MKKVTRKLFDLLKIESVSENEEAIINKLACDVRKLGINESQIKIDSANKKIGAGNTGNLIVTLPGNIKGDRVLFSAHADTVPVCKGSIPIIDGEYIVSETDTGLGGDNKTGCAIIYNLLEEIIEQDLQHPPITFLWTIQEELGTKGTRYIDLELLENPKMGFNFDGSLDIIIGATGGDELFIEVFGKSSHAGANPELGINALVIASMAISDLKRDGWIGRLDKNGITGSSNLVIVECSQGNNCVPEKIVLTGEIRSYDKGFRKSISSAFNEALKKAVLAEKNINGEIGSYEITVDNRYESFMLKNDLEVVKITQKALNSLGDTKNTLSKANAAFDANWLNYHNIPTVTLATGDENPHTVKERINIKDYIKANEVAMEILHQINKK